MNEKIDQKYSSYPIAPVWVIRILIALVVVLSLLSGYYFTKYQNVRNTLIDIRKEYPYTPEE